MPWRSIRAEAVRGLREVKVDSGREKRNGEERAPCSGDEVQRSGSPAEGPAIRWLCYEEYPLSEPEAPEPLRTEERAMMDQERVKAVREYLQAQFPNGKMEDRYEASSKSQVFRIELEGKIYLTAIRQAFLDDHGAGDIPAALAQFQLVEHLRDLPGERVIVTKDGLAM